MPTILLIRHGESQSNAGQPTSRPESIELTERGWEEAKSIAQELQKSYPSLDLIVTSSYRRALQTADWTKWCFGEQRIPTEIWEAHEFTYLSSALGERYSTIEERRPIRQRYWDQANPSSIDGPGAESFEKFIKRVRVVKERLDNTAYDTVAVFSHHQFICALLWLAEQNSPRIDEQAMREFKEFLDGHPISNGAIVRVQFEKSGERWHHDLLTSHLDLINGNRTQVDVSASLPASSPSPLHLPGITNLNWAAD